MNQVKDDEVELRCRHRTLGMRCTIYVTVPRGTDPRSVNCGGHKKETVKPAATIVPTKRTAKKTIHRDYFVQ